MNKAELVMTFQKATQLPANQAQEYLERFGDIAAAELLGGGHVPLPGIGRLITKQRAARQGRNPRTGAAVTIPASRVVLLRVGKDLKAALK